MQAPMSSSQQSLRALTNPKCWHQMKTANGRLFWYHSETQQTQWQTPRIVEQDERRWASEERSVALTRIPNSDWVLALTNFRHYFFHHPRTGRSIWQPDDPELEKIVAQLEREREQKRADAKNINIEETKGSIPNDVELESIHEEDVDEDQEFMENSENEQEEEIDEYEDDEEEAQEEEAQEEEFGEDDFEHQFMQQEEQEDAPPPISEQDIMDAFMELLKKRKTSPFALFDSIQAELGTDPRFPTDQKLCRQVFEEYCQQEGTKLQQESAETKKAKEPKELLVDLLEQYAVPTQIFDRFYLTHKRKLTHIYMDKKQMERVFKEWAATKKKQKNR